MKQTIAHMAELKSYNTIGTGTGIFWYLPYRWDIRKQVLKDAISGLEDTIKNWQPLKQQIYERSK